MLGWAGWVRTLAKTVLLATSAVAVAGASPAAAGWLGATDLAAPNAVGQDVGAPVVAVARDGTAYAAFQRFDGANTRIAVAMRSPGGGFGATRDLSDAGENGFGPALAVDRQGNATLAWLSSAGGFVIKARFHPAGGDWGPTQTLSAGSIFNGPSVAVGDNGAAVVAWGRSTAGSRVRAEAAIRPAGSPTFGSPLFMSPDAGTQLCQPAHVAMDAAGDVAAIWTKRNDDGSHYLVESAVKRAGQAQFDPIDTRSPTTGSSPCNSDIQMTPGGRVTAVWDFDDTVNIPYVQYADRSTPFASGSWNAAVKLSDPTVSSAQPHLALDDAGNGAATWLAADQLQSAVRAGLGGWTAPKPLSGTTGINGSGHAIAASSSGDAMVAFVGSSNGTAAIFSARRGTNTDFGEVTTVVGTPPGGATGLASPDIALDDQGNGFAVWERNVSSVAGTTSTAQVAGYDPVAPVITSTTVPATGTAGQAVAMSAAATDRMSGVALHFDFGDGGSADGADVQHIYGAAGGYTVTVTGTDAAGNQSTAKATIQIAPAPPPAAGPGGGGPAGGNTGPKGPLRVEAVSALSYDRLSNGNTRLRSLVIDRLVGPEKVRLACIGKRKGCRKAATRTITKHGRKLSLTKYVKGMTLRPKAQLTITVTRPGYVSRIFRYTMVKLDDPKKSTRCVAPGKKKSSPC